MAKRTLDIGIRIEGVRETLRAFNGLPKEASNELRDAALDLAGLMATSVKAAGAREGSQAALVATTVKATRDRVPVVQAGGTKRLGSRRAPAWKLLFGAEFGSNRYTQFPRRHQGSAGIWIFPTIEAESSAIARRWEQAADRIVRAFTKEQG